jgi:2-keto-4-pentenoate hydratase/2-oxohepta-3-ene-1,7-dioic acid hydratase in catechol pathway
MRKGCCYEGELQNLALEKSMRLVTFLLSPGSTPRLGALDAHDQVVDLQQRHMVRFGSERPELASMLDLIESGPGGLDLVRSLVAGEGETLIVGPDVELLAPIPVPPQIRDSMNFLGHLENAIDGRNKRNGITERSPAQKERINAFLRNPSWYKANRFSVTGPDRVVTWPRYSNYVDYEHELACVLWKGGKDIAVSEVESHIFGYMNFNDLSARDVQPDEMILCGPTKSKDFDSSNVFGPWILTADAFDAKSAKMRSWVNGVSVNEGRMSDMHYSFADVIAYASQEETLHAGEVIGSGTVAGGCRLESGDQLNFGDTVDIETDGLGRLSVRIAER